MSATYKRWTEKEEARLLQLMDSGSSTQEIADDLGRTLAAVRARRTQLTDLRGTKHCKAWEPKEVNYILTYAGTMPRKRLAEHLGRTDGAVRRKMEELGVRTRQGRHTLRGIARLFGVSKSFVQSVRDRMDASWCRRDGGLATNRDVVLMARWMLDPANDVRAHVTAAHLRRIIEDHDL